MTDILRGRNHDQSKNWIHPVSSLDQNAERQLDGIHLDKVFIDEAVRQAYKQVATPGRRKSRSCGGYGGGPFNGQAGA